MNKRNAAAPPSPGKNVVLADIGLLYCAAVWGSTFYLVKAALEVIDPVVMVSYRFFLAAFGLLPWVLARRRRWLFLKESAILAAILSALYISQTAGLGYTSASNSGFITGLFVLFVPLFLLAFLKQAPALGQWLAVALSLLGLWTLTGGILGFNRGDAMTLISAAAYAAHLLATDRYVKAGADVVLLAFHQFWMTGLMSLALAWVLGLPLGLGAPRAAGIVVFLALVPTLSAFTIQMLAQKFTPPVKVSLIFSLEPVFAAGFAWTLGGEIPRISAALGGAMIVAAMVMGELSRLSTAKAV